MGKITNIELARFISARIDEILKITGLTIPGLAHFTELSIASIRHSYNMNLITSIETINKICQPLSISLPDFFTSEKPLSIHLDQLPNLQKFKILYPKSNSNQPPKKNGRLSNDVLKLQRQFMIKMIRSSDYFEQPKTIDQMIKDFARDYDMEFTEIRLYGLLRRHLALHEIGKKLLPRKPIPGKKVTDRPYEYYKLHDNKKTI